MFGLPQWPPAGPATNNLDSALIKIDQNLNANNQISGRYFFGNSHQSFPLGVGGGNNLPNTNTNAPIRTQLVSVSWVRTVSPQKVNEARFGWNRYRNGFFPQDAAIFGDPNVSLGLNTIDLQGAGTANPRDFGLPTIEVSGLAHLGSSAVFKPAQSRGFKLAVHRQFFMESGPPRHQVWLRIPADYCEFVQRPGGTRRRSILAALRNSLEADSMAGTPMSGTLRETPTRTLTDCISKTEST